MKKGPLVVEFFFWEGDEILPSFVGIVINHDIRIPMKQPVFFVFFFVAQFLKEIFTP